MEINSVYVRICLFHEFHQDKNVDEAQRIICVTYGDSVIDKSTCRRQFRKLKNGDFELSDKPRSGRTKIPREHD